MKRSQRLLIPALLGLLVALLLSIPAQAQEWAWAQSYGGTTGIDDHNRLALDADGNLYGVGSFEGTTTFGDSTLTSVGPWDGFIIKYDPGGDVLWARAVPGPGDWELLEDVATTADGVYTAGIFSEAITFGATTLASAGGEDAFLAKYSSDGDALWAIRFGGTGDDRTHRVIAAPDGSAYVAGFFSGTATLGTTTLTSAGAFDAFLTKVSPAGEVLWAVRAGGATLNDRYWGVAVNADGDPLVTGTFRGTVDVGPLSLTSVGERDVWIVRYSPEGDVLSAASAGGPGAEVIGLGIEVDEAGNTYVGGIFGGAPVTFGTTTLQNQDWDAFLAKYSPDGDALWARRVGGPGYDELTDIAVTSVGSAVVAGFFSETADFGPFALTSAGDGDAFVAGFTAEGDVAFADRAGGAGLDEAEGLALGPEGVYVGGHYHGPVEFGSVTLTDTGKNIFLALYEPAAVAHEPVPAETGLTLSVYPNPAASLASVRFTLRELGPARLALYDLLGREVAVVTEGAYTASEHAVVIDAAKLPPGLYVLRLTTPSGTATRRLTVVR